MRYLVITLGVVVAVLAASLECAPIIHGGVQHPAVALRTIAKPDSPRGSAHSSPYASPSRSPSPSSLPKVHKSASAPTLSKEPSLAHYSSSSNSPSSHQTPSSAPTSAQASSSNTTPVRSGVKKVTFAPQPHDRPSSMAKSAPVSPSYGHNERVPKRNTQSAPSSPVHVSSKQTGTYGVKSYVNEVRQSYEAAQAKADRYSTKLRDKNRSSVVSRVMKQIPGTLDYKKKMADRDAEGKWLKQYQVQKQANRMSKRSGK